MKVILVGKGCVGKDFLKRELEAQGYQCSVSYTTRPPRTGEVEGLTYYYISEDQFLAMVANEEFREWNKFAEKWYYGTSKVHFEQANLFIMTPSGIAALNPAERQNALVVYLDIAEDVRRARLLERKDVDDPERRLTTDRIDFTDFTDYDVSIQDPNFDAVTLCTTITDLVAQRIQEMSAAS